jgi:hypothetical protein
MASGVERNLHLIEEVELRVNTLQERACKEEVKA